MLNPKEMSWWCFGCRWQGEEDTGLGELWPSTEDITVQFLAPFLGGSLTTTDRVHNLGLWSRGKCHSGTKETEQKQGWLHPVLPGEEQGHALPMAAMS